MHVQTCFLVYFGLKVLWSGRWLFTLGAGESQRLQYCCIKDGNFWTFANLLRFFLGCKYIVCADYRCISCLKGLIACSFCSETFISLHNFSVLYCSWWLGMEVLHPLVPISSDGLTSCFFLPSCSLAAKEVLTLVSWKVKAMLLLCLPQSKNVRIMKVSASFSAVTQRPQALLLVLQCDTLSFVLEKCWRRVLGN